MELACNLCGRPISSALAGDIGQLAALLAVHLIDEHWDLVQRIHATTGNPIGRGALMDQLEAEFYE